MEGTQRQVGFSITSDHVAQSSLHPVRLSTQSHGDVPVLLEGHTPSEASADADNGTAVREGQAISLYTISPAPRRNHWVAVLFGQCVALIASSMNATSYTLVQRYEVKTQLFQLFFIYLFLVSHLFYRLVDTMQPISPVSELSTLHLDDSSAHNIEPAERRVNPDNVEQVFQHSSVEAVQQAHYHIPFLPRVRLRMPCILYFCFSLVDIIPNFMSLYSYRYSSLTSTTLLSSLTVPSTMLFSRIIFRKIFSCHHYGGVLLCVLGATLTVYVDAFGNGEDSNATPKLSDEAAPQSQSYIGDMLAIASAVMYGLGDCIAEYSVKNVDRNEYLGMLGFFGLLITGVAMPVLEYEAMHDLFRTLTESSEAIQIIGLLVWFVASVCLYYVAEAHFLVSSDATLLNLSMQSVSLWVVLFTLTLYDDSGPPPSTFFLALVLVGSGVFLYEVGFCQSRNEPTSRRPQSDNPHVETIEQEHVSVINYQTLAGVQ